MNQHYEENGYLLVPGVFSASEVKEMRDGIARILEVVEQTEHDQNHTWSAVGDSTLKLRGFHDLQYHDAVFTRMVAHPRLVEVLTELIGPNVQLHHSKMLVKPPEQGAPFPMHQDQPYFPHERHSLVAASVHLDETDEENGCLWVQPRSHHDGRRKHRTDTSFGPFRVGYDGDDRGVAMPVSKGSVLVFSSLVMHRSGPNTTDRPRRSWIIQFCPVDARSALSGKPLDDRLLVARDGRWLDEPIRERELDLLAILANYDQS